MRVEPHRRDFLIGVGAAAASSMAPIRGALAVGEGASAVSSDLAYRRATDLIDALARKHISSVELTDHAIARIQALDKPINAVVVRDFDRARTAAKAADAALVRGETRPLLGLPMTVKEAFSITGLPTTWGNPKFEDWQPNGDSLVVTRLKNAGAVILGKTNVPFMLQDWQSYNEIYGTPTIRGTWGARWRIVGRGCSGARRRLCFAGTRIGYRRLATLPSSFLRGVRAQAEPRSPPAARRRPDACSGTAGSRRPRGCRTAIRFVQPPSACKRRWTAWPIASARPALASRAQARRCPILPKQRGCMSKCSRQDVLLTFRLMSTSVGPRRQKHCPPMPSILEQWRCAGPPSRIAAGFGPPATRPICVSGVGNCSSRSTWCCARRCRPRLSFMTIPTRTQGVSISTASGFLISTRSSGRAWRRWQVCPRRLRRSDTAKTICRSVFRSSAPISKTARQSLLRV